MPRARKPTVTAVVYAYSWQDGRHVLTFQGYDTPPYETLLRYEFAKGQIAVYERAQAVHLDNPRMATLIFHQVDGPAPPGIADPRRIH